MILLIISVEKSLKAPTSLSLLLILTSAGVASKQLEGRKIRDSRMSFNVIFTWRKLEGRKIRDSPRSFIVTEVARGWMISMTCFMIFSFGFNKNVRTWLMLRPISTTTFILRVHLGEAQEQGHNWQIYPLRSLNGSKVGEREQRSWSKDQWGLFFISRFYLSANDWECFHPFWLSFISGTCLATWSIFDW